MRTFLESEREIPVVAQYDVIVCGGGPAGIAAAISAARNGARTCIIEQHGCLGGIWTAGSLSYILDGKNKTGILQEILAELRSRGASQGFVWDVETTKLVLEDMCVREGIEIRLHTRVAAAFRNEDQSISYVITESKSGREAWEAQVYVDATGDGDLAAHANCGFDMGEPGTGSMQPMSLIALVSGLQPDDMYAYTKIEKKSRLNLLDTIRSGGYDPSYHSPGLWHIKDTLYILMANHQYGVAGTNASDLTRATMQARREVFEVVKALQSLGGIWDKMAVVATGAQIGVREGRRIHGRYQVTIDDMIAGVRHYDKVCRVTFKVDVHATGKSGSKSFESHNDDYRERVKEYDIPMRALIAKDVNNLLLAGRCISGDFLAHSSYRVTGNAVQMGQAAGVLAAVSAEQRCHPHEVPWSSLENKLK